MEGSEIIFFQGNPNPISYESIDGETGNVTDRSGEYMDRYVMENALKQTSLGPKVDLGNLLSHLSWFKSPTNLVYLLMFLVVAYSSVVTYSSRPLAIVTFRGKFCLRTSTAS
ncbi:hypothetical protein ES703_122619 [subsurface metagenome]